MESLASEARTNDGLAQAVGNNLIELITKVVDQRLEEFTCPKKEAKPEPKPAVVIEPELLAKLNALPKPAYGRTPRKKMTKDMVRKVRAIYEQTNAPAASLAKLFNVQSEAIRRVIARETFADVR